MLTDIRSGLIIATVAVLGLLPFTVSFLFTPSQSQPYRETSMEFARQPMPKAPEPPEFVDRTFQSGLSAFHLQSAEYLTGLDEALGAGVCAFDYNDDGWVDLLVVGGSGQTRYYRSNEWWHTPRGSVLYRNRGNGTFEDVSTASGLRHQGWGMGCVSGDLDNDGDADVLITGFAANTLFRNNSDGTFTDVTALSGIKNDRWSTGAALADYDGDGRLDLYVVNYVDYQRGSRTLEAQAGFKSAMPAAFDASLYDAQPDRLYRNIGNLQFEDKTISAGVADPSGRGVAAVWLDIDRDRLPDLFVSDDTGSPNRLYLNQGGGSFREVGAEAGINSAMGTRGIAVGDLNADGDMEVVLASGITRAPLVLSQKLSTDQPPDTDMVPALRDRAEAFGPGSTLSLSFSGWSPALGDFDNDGRLDLFIGNGLASPDADAPKQTQGQPNQLWLNLGDKLQNSIASGGSPLTDALSTRGSVVFDPDNDGDLDILLANNNNQIQLLVNEGSKKNWLGIRLVARRGNRDAIGARVSVKTSQGLQHRQLYGAQGFLSDSERRLHFGLGDDDRVQALTVSWGDGTQDRFHDVPGNRYLLLRQGHPELVELPTQPKISRPTLQLALESAEANHRAQYLRWLARAFPLEEIDDEVAAGMLDAEPSVRLAAIETAFSPSPAGLALLVGALRDVSEPNRIAAIEALGSYESELSIPALLRAFADPTPGVRCALAEVFAFFFREEEAVVRQKYLAVPPLVRMLSGSDPKVRVCAARALGEAEHYRGLAPLLDRLDDPVLEVRIAAIRSLGLIRERMAAEPLRRLLTDPAQAARLRAEVLVALRRVENSSISSLLGELFPVVVTGESPPEAMTTGLETIASLLEDVELSAIAPPSYVSQWLIGRLGAVDRSTLESTLGHRNAASILRIITAGRNYRGVSIAAKLAESPSPELRAEAMKTLFAVDPIRAAGYARRGLGDASELVRETTLDTLMTHRVNVPVAGLLDYLENSATGGQAVFFLAWSTDPRARATLRNLLDTQTTGADVLLAAMRGLLEAERALPSLPAHVFANPDPRVRAAAFDYWTREQGSAKRIASLPMLVSQGLEDVAFVVRKAALGAVASRNEAWSAQLLERQLLDSSVPRDLRLETLRHLAKRGTTVAKQSILRLARLRHDPFSNEAFQFLVAFPGEDVDELLLRIFRSSRESLSARFAAADVLLRRGHSVVLSELRRSVAPITLENGS